MIKVLQKIINLMGYDAQISKHQNFKDKKFSYGLIKSTSAYSPWIEDREFIKTYEVIKSHTLVDIYRCYELWSLIAEANKINSKGAFLEVGVWRGGTSALIAKKLNLLNADTTLYAADTFQGVVKSTKNDSLYNDGEHNDTNIELVQKLFHETLHLDNIQILKGIFPDDTQQLVPKDEMFKFCHIDVDVYKSAQDIVDWVWGRLVIGGIILFDDYGFISCDGITQFLNEKKKEKNNIFIYNLNGHGILIKSC